MAGRKKKAPLTVAAPVVLPTSVFVIMPFRETPTRNGQQLTAFYQDVLKRPIESESFIRPHSVRRSEDAFNITEQIIKDLYSADVVISDLSGLQANPNVMYELGIRLAVSNNPVILIREAHKDNRTIFDIGGFFAETYDPLDYAKITAHVIGKLHRFERGDETYESPVLKILQQDEPLIRVMVKRRAAHLMNTLSSSLKGSMRLFAGAIVQFVQTQAEVEFGETPSDVLDVMQRNASIVEALDWSRFRFAVGSQPAVDAYLSTLYLDGVVGGELESKFTECILDYHSYFLSGDLWFDQPAYELVLAYLGETLVLAGLARAMAAHLLARNDAERAKTIEYFDAYYVQKRL